MRDSWLSIRCISAQKRMYPDCLFCSLGGLMNRFVSIVAAFLMALTFSSLTYAQTGSIVGTVTDKTGAVVQNADITVRSVETNQTRTAKSSAGGAYSIPSLVPG